MSTPVDINKASPDPTEERTRGILNELEMAIDWQRPCLILIVYRSEFIRAHLQLTLQHVISDLEQNVSEIHVNNKHYDIPLILAEDPQRGNTIFFIAGLQWGGGRGRKNAYRALNIHREYLVDHQIRAIFWLTPNEAASMTRHAPDFWAFRHRVFEFFDLPSIDDVHLSAQDTLAGKWQSLIGTKDIAQEITHNEKMLSDSLLMPATLSIQAEFHLRIGALHWVDEQYIKARKHLEASLRIAEKLNDHILQVECLDGLGILHQSMNHHKKAVSFYKKAISINPVDELAWSNLATIYLTMGYFREALDAAEQATIHNPSLSDTWLIRGNIYYNLGFYEDAVAAYQRTLRLKPEHPRLNIYLGKILLELGNSRLASHYLKKSNE